MKIINIEDNIRIWAGVLVICSIIIAIASHQLGFLRAKKTYTYFDDAESHRKEIEKKVNNKLDEMFTELDSIVDDVDTKTGEIIDSLNLKSSEALSELENLRKDSKLAADSVGNILKTLVASTQDLNKNILSQDLSFVINYNHERSNLSEKDFLVDLLKFFDESSTSLSIASKISRTNSISYQTKLDAFKVGTSGTLKENSIFLVPMYSRSIDDPRYYEVRVNFNMELKHINGYKEIKEGDRASLRIYHNFSNEKSNGRNLLIPKFLTVVYSSHVLIGTKNVRLKHLNTVSNEMRDYPGYNSLITHIFEVVNIE